MRASREPFPNPRPVLLVAVLIALASPGASGDDGEPLTLDWERNILKIQGERIPGGGIEVLYIEAYCRPGSTDADWGKHTVIGHRTELLERSADGRELRLRCTLTDGVIVEHHIHSGADEVDFRLTVRNPTERVSEAHWAQPCIRVGDFTGLGDPGKPDTYEYLDASFIFLDDRLTRMPTPDWATEARYVPGQVWAAPGVSRDDVNPRPLNPRTPSNGLIGCFSKDGSKILATAWEPYQELFQGVITCLHSDFRIGGLEPGEAKEIRGKIYVVANDVEALLRRYERDFPEQASWRPSRIAARQARIAFGGVQPRVAPDGTRLALSYQGAICTLSTEGGTITRLTRDAGFDIEPCWSPDGTSIAFLRTPSFSGGTVKLIGARDGREREVRPRMRGRGKLCFHPDGRRLLGRFGKPGEDLRLAFWDFENGEVEPVELPAEVQRGSRAVFALSPDGDEIACAVHADVAGEQEGNNGPGASLWLIPASRANPDSAPDTAARAITAPRRIFDSPARIYDLHWNAGAGLILVSDFGASHYDLWQLDPRRRGDGARRLGSGQADEDRPSMPAIGKQVYFTDNHRGATAISRLDLDSGERREIVSTRIDFREASGHLRMRLVDAASGSPLVARVSLRRRGGKFHAPPGSLYRYTAGLLHFYARDRVEVDLPAGEYEAVIFRGIEYRPSRTELAVVAGKTVERTIRLERAVRVPGGLYSGENHIHANYGYGAWYSTPSSVRDQCEGENLNVANIMVANSDGEGVYDREYFRGRPDPASGSHHVLYWNEEFRSTIWGHLTLVGLDQLVEPVFTGFLDTTNPRDVPSNREIARRARRRSGIASYTHPARNRQSPYDSAYAAKGLPVDVALGEIDTLDVMGSGYEATLPLWYRLLNCGFRLPAASGTDCFLNRLNSLPPGWGRTYVRIDGAFSYDAFTEGQRAGRSFVTSGPILQLKVGGKQPGETLRLEGPSKVAIHASCSAPGPIEGIELIRNGEVVARGDPGGGGGTTALLDESLSLESGGWIAARTRGSAPQNWPVRWLAAHSNPVWVEVKGHPAPPARAEAEYFLEWIDRLDADLQRRGRIPFGLESVERQLEEARSVYREIAGN